MESTLVIKVRYGDTLRRFNACVNGSGQLDLDMSGLRAKIIGLFNFALNADLTLTYVDEDGDIVTLVDDDDLRDVMNQSLKFLSVNVQLNNDKYGKSYAKSSSCSTPVRSPRVQYPLPNINIGTDMMKSVPEPFREALSDLASRICVNLTTKIVSPNPVISEIVDCFSKTGQTSLTPSQHSGATASSSSQPGAAQNHASVVPAETNATNDESSLEVRIANVTRGVGVPENPISSSVDLNLDPPCDSNPSGFASTNSAPTPFPVDRKKTKKQNAGQPSGKSVVGIGASSSSNDSTSARSLGNECPFSGIPVVNDSSVPPILTPINSYWRSNGRNDAVVGMFHRGVQCDGCGVHPITGPRYKSKVREDYDLCSICFAEMGNEADYIKMDRPVFHRHPRSFKGSHDPAPSYWVGPPPLPSVPRHCGIRTVRAKLDSRFILDVNLLDGTMMAPSTPFTKIWRMRNSGSIVWPQGARLVWIGGDRFSLADSVELEIPADGVPVDGELDIAVDFTSPELPGRYISYWRMASPSGTKFGQRVWVLIQVDAYMKDFVNGVRGLNLNLPPDCSGSKNPQIIDVNLQPEMDSGFLEPSNSTSVPVPIVDVEEPKKEQELNFPITDTLLVGDGVSSPASNQAPSSVSYPIIDGVPSPASNQAPSSVSYPIIDGVPSPASKQAPSSVSYPIIDLREVAPVVPSEALSAMDVPSSSDEVTVKDAVEKSLLKELEEMGFKQIDLNKEILRMNEYDLEQSVDDLCGVYEWDPILEELQEMGFSNKEMNRRLLKKNNGSIKRVVMDLLTGEKA